MAAEASAAQAEQLSIAATQAALDLTAQAASLDTQSAGETQLAQAAQAQADYYANLATNPPSTYEQTLFAYDLAGHLIGEYALDGTVKVEYAWLEDLPLAQLRTASGPLGGTTVYWYQADHLNTPTSLTDEAKQMVWDAVREPFGKAELVNSTVTNDLRFPGQFEDAETGLHYNYFRDYDPGTGRYVESDPIGLSGGPNGFVYAESKPQQLTDPLGLWTPMMHRRMTKEAARRAGCDKLADDLGNAAYDADKGTQGPFDSHNHHMGEPAHDGEPAESTAEAQAGFETFVADQLAVGGAAGVGTAAHAVQDGFAPGHRDFQTWNGTGYEMRHNPLALTGHILADFFASPATYNDAVAATQALIEEAMKNNPCLCK